jgi:hypothetical protein
MQTELINWVDLIRYLAAERASMEMEVGRLVGFSRELRGAIQDPAFEKLFSAGENEWIRSMDNWPKSSQGFGTAGNPLKSPWHIESISPEKPAPQPRTLQTKI